MRANPNVKLGGVDYVAAETAVGARKPILDAYKAKVGRAVEVKQVLTQGLRSAAKYRRYSEVESIVAGLLTATIAA